jgi:hypothetical protein
MLFVRPVERPPPHMQQRIAAPGPRVDLRKPEAACVQAQRERAAASWEAVRKQEAADEKAALHERYRQQDIIACARKGLGMYEHKFLSGPNTLTQAWAELELLFQPAPVPAVEPRVERMLCSETLIYKNNIFDNSFVYGSRVCDAAQRAETRPPARTAVIEVD